MAKNLLVSVLLICSVYTKVSRASVNDNEVHTRNDDECNLPESLREEIHGFQTTVDYIIENIAYGAFGRYAGETYKGVMEMTDKFGARLSGSQTLEDSIDYMVDEFRKAGLDNVHTEDAMVPKWIRGIEYAELITPRRIELKILGLGFSVPTPHGGITAEVIVVETFEELEAIPASQVDGKIVVFAPEWIDYSTTNQYRRNGASAASRKGAVATLIRSMTPFSIGSPHTGSMTYANDVRKIPTASITLEDAGVLLRLYRKGHKMTIKLEMYNVNYPMVTSRNVVGEFEGLGGSPNKSVIVLSGHLDSWDVGHGAMDDGGGCYIAWKAIHFLKQMAMYSKRTIRVVLWTGEELGTYGSRAYAQMHAPTEVEEFNMLMESDSGTFDPLGLDFSGSAEAACIVKEVVSLMGDINATYFKTPISGAPDLASWSSRGFPTAGLANKNQEYFWYHHTTGDSMLVLDSKSLDKGAAFFAAVSYVLANLSVDLPKTVTQSLFN